MKSIGNWILWVITIITIGLFVSSKVDLNEIMAIPWLSASQALALVGTAMLSMSFVLSSRARFLESLFGGLDKVMKVHHMVGGIAFLLIINHPLFLAVDAIPNFQIATKYFWLSTNMSYSLGVGALYTLIITLLLTLVIKLPYDLWLKTHDFMGLALLLGSLHVYTISSDVSRYMPLRLWMFALLGVGFFSFIYKVYLYSTFGPKYKYIVSTIRRLKDVYEITLLPIDEKVSFLSGQFVFINFEEKGLEEKHPFTISSSPTAEELRISVKALGDYTVKLNRLKNGVVANVWGPYGRFYKGMNSEAKEIVMIAGGIGITPYLSMLNFELNKKLERKIWLFYGANSPEDAVYDEEITNLEEKLVNLNYFRHFGGTKPRVNVELLREKIGELSDKIYYICGPTAMMENLSEQLIKNGVKRKNIIMEDFAFK